MEITRAYVKSILPHRDPEGHKGTFGKVYCLCGAVGYTGAPVLAAAAAVRSGSGLVYLGVPEDIRHPQIHKAAAVPTGKAGIVGGGDHPGAHCRM